MAEQSLQNESPCAECGRWHEQRGWQRGACQRMWDRKRSVLIDGWFSFFMAVVFYKVAVNIGLVHPEPLLPEGKCDHRLAGP